MNKNTLMHVGYRLFIIISQIIGIFFIGLYVFNDRIILKLICMVAFNWILFFIIGYYIKNYAYMISGYYKLNSRYELVSILYDLLKEISELEEPEKVYGVILDAAIQAIPKANRGTIILSKNEKAVYEAAIGFDMCYLDLIELSIEETALYIGTHGKMDHAVITNDIIKTTNTNLDRTTLELLIKAGVETIRSSIAVPIKVNKKTIGSINLDSERINSFTEKDAQVLEIFSYEVSRIVQLYQVMEENIKNSRFDDLTHIINRGYGSKLFKAMIEEHKAFLLVSIDLNKLKITNDQYGHDSGDEVICSFVNNMKLFIDERVVFARYGGDEFILLFQGYNYTEVAVIMDDAQHFFVNHGIKKDGHDIGVSFSYGIVEFPKEATNYEQLLKLADERMYIHKRMFENKKK